MDASLPGAIANDGTCNEFAEKAAGKEGTQLRDAANAQLGAEKVVHDGAKALVRTATKIGEMERDNQSNVLHCMREHLNQERHRSRNKASEQTWDELLRNPANPEGQYRMMWDVALLLVIGYCAIVVPIDLGLGGFDGHVWDGINLFMIVFFSIDMILNFKTAYYNSYGNLERRYSYIARSYLKTWFFLDLFSTIPFDMILSSYNFKGTVLMRLPRIIKMVRLARLMRLAKVQHVLQQMFGLQLLTNVYLVFLVRFSSLFVALLLITHWLACSFCALAEIPEENQDLYGDVVKYGWTYAGIKALDMDRLNRYQAAFYFAFCSAIGPKPGDIKFETTYCRYFYMLFGFIRPLVNAAIMGVLTNLIVSQNNKKGHLKQKKQALGIFMQLKKVKRSTQHQVMAYLEHAEVQMETLQDFDAIKTLSPTLREEVAYRTLKHSISSFKLFDQAFGKPFVQQLCLVLKLEHFGPDDVICQEGHFLHEMFFINSGHLKLFKIEGADEFRSVRKDLGIPKVSDAGQIEAGMTFGAMALLQSGDFESQVSVLCFEFCELSVLTKKDFLSVVSRNPYWLETLKKISSALCSAENPTELLARLGKGDDEELLETVLSEPKQINEDSKRHYKSFWRTAMKQIGKLRHLLNDPRPIRGFKSAEVQQGRDNESGASQSRTAGFQTMQMAPAERHIMEELGKISSKVRAVDQRVQAFEERAIQQEERSIHQTACLERLTDCLKRIEERLDTPGTNGAKA